LTLPRISILLAIALAVVFPFVAPGYWTHVMIIAYYYALVAASWSLVAGFSGQFSFGQVAMATIGAYTSAFLSLNLAVPPLIGLLAGGAMAAAASYGLGFLCLRMRGPYLALTTIAFSESFRLIMSSEFEVTRGTLGLSVPPLVAAWGTSKIPPYLLMLAILGISLFILARILSSPLGLFFRSVREDEDAASVMGVDTTKYKILAFTIGGFFAGVAGAFFGHYLQLVSPIMGSLGEMGLVISMVVVGGTESLAGPVLGAVLLEGASEYFRVYGELYKVLFGLLMILTLRFMPRGLLIPLLRRLVAKLGPQLGTRPPTVQPI